MIKATFHTSSFYLNNRIFDISDEISNRDDCLYCFYLLKKIFEKNGIDLSTQDINPPSKSDFIIYNNMPKIKEIIPNKKSFLLLLESEVIMPKNWDIKNHKYFTKIFTWSDDFVDSTKYFKMNLPNKIPVDLNFDSAGRNKLCTMIACNKSTPHPLELYSERIKTIRWFEQHHPEDFDLYGMGWDKYCFKDGLSLLNSFGFITKILKSNYPSYKGAVKSKNETYEKYRFAICYENARDISGYISEKIFDCFFAGCVPVYWGVSNVAEHIPSDTFINRRDFKTHEELYEFIKNMPDDVYEGYLNAIKNFIKSNKIYPFSAECFADTLSREILGKYQ